MTNKNLKAYTFGVLEPRIVNFSHNWNSKLDCPYFTTIRNAKTHAYYSAHVHETFVVNLNGKEHCRAKLISAELVKLEEIRPELLVLDTGTIDWSDLFKKFNVVDWCVLLLFKRG